MLQKKVLTLRAQITRLLKRQYNWKIFHQSNLLLKTSQGSLQVQNRTDDKSLIERFLSRIKIKKMLLLHKPVLYIGQHVVFPPLLATLPLCTSYRACGCSWPWLNAPWSRAHIMVNQNMPHMHIDIFYAISSLRMTQFGSKSVSEHLPLP